ncbi:hypothetical protein Save01_01786 [Streptomyces avermitilis]
MLNRSNDSRVRATARPANVMTFTLMWQKVMNSLRE